MRRAGTMLALGLLLGLGHTDGRLAGPTPAERPAAIGPKHRGVSFEHYWGRHAATLGYGSDASGASLKRLSEIGATWVAVTPFGFQRTPHDTVLRWGGSRSSETDDRLHGVARQAHAHGLQVMLKPHIWLRPPAWVGEVAPRTEAGWGTWFGEYRAFILHYARLAQDADIDALCIGNELRGTTHREREWRELIAEVRKVFDGVVTYGAHADEVWDVPFWDALDYIGVSAYYTLSQSDTPTRADLVAGWDPLVSRFERLARRWDRPVLFTELGYRSVDFAARHPWRFDDTTPVNLTLQAEAYSAFFEAVWPQPWFAGVYWWKWLSSLDDGGADDDDYTPRAKPAEAVLHRYFAN